MMQFDYTIHNPLGMDFRHAGLLAKLAKRYTDTTITVAKGDQSAKAGQLTRMMGLAIKSGDKVVVTVDGPAEKNAFFNARVFFEKNL